MRFSEEIKESASNTTAVVASGIVGMAVCKSIGIGSLSAIGIPTLGLGIAGGAGAALGAAVGLPVGAAVGGVLIANPKSRRRIAAHARALASRVWRRRAPGADDLYGIEG